MDEDKGSDAAEDYSQVFGSSSDIEAYSAELTYYQG